MPRTSFAEFCRLHFPALLTGLLCFAVLHTVWATSLDGFTIDEPYHVAAGATYLRSGDFRINPEHPPLVKLVAALAEPASLLRIGPFPVLDDKYQERIYTQTAVYKNSDYHRVQRHARVALIAFNTLLLLALGVLLRRVFSPAIAACALLLLALDPTVAAHMPVVMTDLPMALLGTACCCLTVLALRCRRWRDWVALGVACGLLMGTKHSAPLILLPLLTGCASALAWERVKGTRQDGGQQVLRLLATVALCFAVLWSLYGFRFHESRERDAKGRYVETFNRTLEKKIGDLHSPLLKRSLTIAEEGHLLPRAYLWGMADTLRAGVEGRPSLVRAFGRDYFDKAPAWIPFADLLVKVPLPFQVLALAGVVLLCLRRLPRETARPMAVFVAMFVFFMAFIAKNGVFYAGLRHWLFAVPLLSVPAAAALVFCMESSRRGMRWVPALALLLIGVPTLPQQRIWEYHNILVGGSGNAWKYFTNESVDLGQRSDEMFTYYRAHIAPEQPLSSLGFRQQMEAEGVKPWEPTPEQLNDGHFTGWFMMNAPGLPIKNWEHIEVLRDTAPVARLGNEFVYHGSFYMPYAAGGVIARQAMRELDLPDGDKVKAEAYLKKAVIFNPEISSAFLELGNFDLARGDKAGALERYQQAVAAEKDSEQVRQLLRAQIALLQAHPAGEVAPMRRPGKE